MRGCISAAEVFLELDLEAELRCRERRSDSFKDLVGDLFGDLDRDFLEGGRGDASRCLLVFFESASEFFLGLKIPGRTIGCGRLFHKDPRVLRALKLFLDTKLFRNLQGFRLS